MIMEMCVAVVDKVIAGKHGDYAVAHSDRLSSITFSLQTPVWQESDHPEEGMEVVLSDIRKKRAGWRAMSARFVRPSDESK